MCVDTYPAISIRVSKRFAHGAAFRTNLDTFFFNTAAFFLSIVGVSTTAHSVCARVAGVAVAGAVPAAAVVVLPLMTALYESVASGIGRILTL